MSPAQLLAHFDRVAEAPRAVPRLRQFILDLAVRGKLVEQDASDPAVSGLLSSIRSDRPRSVSTGAGNQRPVPDLRSHEEWFEIPSTWRWVRLGAITQIVMGHSPPGDTYNKSGDGMPLINGPVEFTEGPFGKTVVNQYTTSPTNTCEEGDLLLCVRGSTTGRTNVAGFRACIGRGVAAIRPLFADAYVRLFIWSHRASIIAMGRGVAFPSISRQQIELLPVPLPPLSEQHRIVVKVDELMALCDRLEAAQAERERRRDRLVAASLKRLNQPPSNPEFKENVQFHFRHASRLLVGRTHIEDCRRAILNLAVLGRLVQQTNENEPATVLHGRLIAALSTNIEKRDMRIRKELSAARAGSFGEGIFPRSWLLTNFDSVNSIVSGVAKGRSLRGRPTAPYPYLRVANVQRGFLDLSVIKEIETTSDELERYRLRRGDVLMTEGGDWDKLGRAAIWNDEIHDCIHQNHIYRIRSANKEALLPAWIALFANSALGRSYFEDASKQTTNLASINMTQLRSCPLPLPPTAEQHRIVAKVDELMAICDRLEAQLETTQTESRRLLEAVLYKALAVA
jgi:type I restriction enzyme S subunit